MASAVFNVQADVIGGFQASSDIVKSVLQVGLSDDVHHLVVVYLDRRWTPLHVSVGLE